MMKTHQIRRVSWLVASLTLASGVSVLAHAQDVAPATPDAQVPEAPVPGSPPPAVVEPVPVPQPAPAPEPAPVVSPLPAPIPPAPTTAPASISATTEKQTEVAASTTTTAQVAEAPAVKPVAAPVDSDGVRVSDAKPLFEVGSYKVRAFGYAQAQYQNFQISEEQMSADGQRLLNFNGFSLARARAIVEGRNDYSALALEYDLANINSTGTGIQRAEATLHYTDKTTGLPFVAMTMGMFRTPFGFEAARSARVRLFTENATVTQAFFPGQSDLGVRAEGGYAWFRYAVGMVNGHPINEPRFGGRSPTKEGDVLGRLGVDANMGPLHLVAGASLLKGRGFSPGTNASKDSIQVRNVGESGVVTPTSITLLPGRAALPSHHFSRWATGADVELSAKLGRPMQLTARGEFMFGNNIDRGLFIADPVNAGYDLRSFGVVSSLEALLYDVGWLAFRYDFYDPNPDSAGRLAGKVVKVAQRIDTYSFLAGFQLPGTLTRLIAQYDHVQDNLGLSVKGTAKDLKNDRFTLRLQVSL